MARKVKLQIRIEKEDLQKPRRFWVINPRTRIQESQKRYRRSRAKQEVHRSIREDLGKE